MSTYLRCLIYVFDRLGNMGPPRKRICALKKAESVTVNKNRGEIYDAAANFEDTDLKGQPMGSFQHKFLSKGSFSFSFF